jgi:hypothetical protein
MKIEDIRDLMEKDSKIDDTALDAESLKIPYLHSKWYSIFIDELRLLRGLEQEYNRLHKEKTEYYLGKADDEVYEKKPLDHKILKQDLDIYLKADDDLMKLESRKILQQMKVEMIESFIKNINQRTFIIRNAIEFMKFKNGIA